MTDGDRVALWYFPQTAVTPQHRPVSCSRSGTGRSSRSASLSTASATSRHNSSQDDPGSARRVDAQLIERVRTLLPDDHAREVRMFGVTAIMVDDAMAVAVHKDGSLLVRVDPAEDAALLNNPHASRAQMGTGRSMGEGWIRVDAKAVRGEAALAEWLRPPPATSPGLRPSHT